MWALHYSPMVFATHHGHKTSCLTLVILID
jgi:hypothetical protein